MKKVIFALAAVVALAACSKEQTVVADRGDAIGFDSFIENSTRAIDPSYNANKLVDGFKVWGTVKGNASNSPMLLFDGVEIVRNNKAYGAAWEYVNNTDAQYWIPNAEYNFVAIANATSVTTGENGMPTAIKYTANNTDLIYTLTGVTAQTNENSVSNVGAIVTFNFNHLLSKVHFNFVNQSGSDNCKFEITNIKITSGHFASGTYTIGEEEPWGSTTAATSALDFGNASNATAADAANTAIQIANGAVATSHYAHLLIPGTQALNISFNQKLIYGTTETTKTVTAALPSTAFAANGSYVITVTLKAGSKIDFSVGSMGSWDEGAPSINIP
jgi:hypothetical protein